MTYDTGGTQLSEVDSRGVPHSRAECEWAHERPARHRVATPKVGDTVLYRHTDWDTPTDAEVISVQDPDDVTDPHLWTAQVDEQGRQMMFQGHPVMAPKPDPWPTLRLKTRFGTVDTREARLRGSPGWLPLDWQARHRPVPEISPAPTVQRRSGSPVHYPMGG